jgi:hypothetical protein
MPLKAKLDGRNIVSVLCSEEDWIAAQAASRGNGDRLRMACCDAPAMAKHSPLDLRFFAHKPGFDRCPSAGESDEHEALKAAAARAVCAAANGWSAEVEVSGTGWRADVLAVRGSVKIAIEVQLSSQAKRETGERNHRFVVSEVTPFWLKGERNHSNDFGAGLQASIQGTRIREKIASVNYIVTAFLGKVERQVRLANALSKLLKSLPGWEYKIERQGTIPAWFEMNNQGRRQQILLGELGPALLPRKFRPMDGQSPGSDQFAGAIIQLRVKAEHLRGYRSSSFQIDDSDLLGSLNRHIRPILEGRIRWRGKENEELVPGSFIHYEEKCPECGREYLRVTHLLIGHPRYPKALYPEFIDNDWEYFEPELYQIEGLAHEMGLPLGELTPKKKNHWPYDESVLQSCPGCGADAPAPLCDEGEILAHWADREVHVRFWRPVPGNGWGHETEWVERPILKSDTWTSFIEEKRAAREGERREEQRRRAERAAEQKRQLEERERQREEERLRKEEEEKAREEEARRYAEEIRQLDEITRERQLEMERERRCKVLKDAATKHIPKPQLRDLWLKCSQPTLRTYHGSPSPSPLDAARDSNEGLERALALLKSSKFH